jgi:hypothetical protein
MKPATTVSKEGVMKNKSIPALVSGFAITLLASVTVWQLVVVTLLVRTMTDVLGLLGRLL